MPAGPPPPARSASPPSPVPVPVPVPVSVSVPAAVPLPRLRDRPCPARVHPTDRLARVVLPACREPPRFDRSAPMAADPSSTAPPPPPRARPADLVHRQRINQLHVGRRLLGDRLPIAQRRRRRRPREPPHHSQRGAVDRDRRRPAPAPPHHARRAPTAARSRLLRPACDRGCSSRRHRSRRPPGTATCSSK